MNDRLDLAARFMGGGTRNMQMIAGTRTPIATHEIDEALALADLLITREAETRAASLHPKPSPPPAGPTEAPPPASTPEPGGGDLPPAASIPDDAQATRVFRKVAGPGSDTPGGMFLSVSGATLEQAKAFAESAEEAQSEDGARFEYHHSYLPTSGDVHLCMAFDCGRVAQPDPKIARAWFCSLHAMQPLSIRLEWSAESGVELPAKGRRGAPKDPGTVLTPPAEVKKRARKIREQVEATKDPAVSP